MSEIEYDFNADQVLSMMQAMFPAELQLVIAELKIAHLTQMVQGPPSLKVVSDDESEDSGD